MTDHDDLLKKLTSDYNAPREDFDREALWNRIQSERDASTRPVRHAPRTSPRTRRWLQTMVAVAAVLLIGIAIGRWSAPEMPDVPTDAPIVAENPTPTRDDQPSMAQRLYARDVLLRTETLLTEFRLAAVSPDPPASRALPWASGLLLETRLLLDSPVSENDELTRLLRDLELILAEIVQLTESADERERREIRQSLEERGVMLRLRKAVPAKVGLKGA